ncbi:MAG: hypothetical protein ACFB10_03865 [Salibacteraceae bacterium]
MSLLLPLALGVVRFRKAPMAYRVLTIYLVYSLLSDAFTITLYFLNVPNLWFWGIYGTGELLLLALCFYYLLPHPIIRFSIGIAALLFLSYLVATRVFSGEPIQVLGNVQVMESAIIVLYALVYFVWIYRDPMRFREMASANFSLVAGLIWYFSGNLLFYSVARAIYHDPELSLWKFYFFHNINHLVMNLLMARAFWQLPKSIAPMHPVQSSKP